MNTRIDPVMSMANGFMIMIQMMTMWNFSNQ